MLLGYYTCEATPPNGLFDSQISKLDVGNSNDEDGDAVDGRTLVCSRIWRLVQLRRVARLRLIQVVCWRILEFDRVVGLCLDVGFSCCRLQTG